MICNKVLEGLIGLMCVLLLACGGGGGKGHVPSTMDGGGGRGDMRLSDLSAQDGWAQDAGNEWLTDVWSPEAGGRDGSVFEGGSWDMEAGETHFWKDGGDAGDDTGDATGGTVVDATGDGGGDGGGDVVTDTTGDGGGDSTGGRVMDATGDGGGDGGKDVSWADLVPDEGPGDVGKEEQPELPPEEQQFAKVYLSTAVLRKGVFEDRLVVTCGTVNGLGEVVPDPGEYEISVSAPDAVLGPEGYLFPTPGTYTASCKDDVNGLEGFAEFVVAHELVAPGISTMAAELALQAALVEGALAAALADDAAAMAEAAEALEASAITIDTVSGDVTLTPPGGWPSLSELEAKLEPGEDDAEYLAVMEDVAQKAASMLAAAQALATSPSLETLAEAAEAAEVLETSLDAVEALEPGGVALFKSMDTWTSMVDAVRQAQNAQTALLIDMFTNPESYQQAPCPGCFTLTELMVNVAISYVVDSLPSYEKLLRDAAKAAASMAIMMELAKAIDAQYPPGPDAPEIQYITPGYGNAVKDGAALTLFGCGFDFYPGNNVVIFIGPSVADSVVDAVDAALSGMSAIKSLKTWSNVWELANALVKAFNALKTMLEKMSKDIPDLLMTGVVTLQVEHVEGFLEEQDFWEQLIHLEPLPKVNPGWLPKAAILVPIVVTRGRGPSYNIVILP